MDLKDLYSYRTIWSEEDKEFIGLCAEFPSLSWLDETPESAFKGIRDMVADVIRDMQENHEELPKPILSKKYSGKFVVRVPPEIHRMLALKAAEENISLNRLVSAKLSACSM